MFIRLKILSFLITMNPFNVILSLSTTNRLMVLSTLLRLVTDREHLWFYGGWRRRRTPEILETWQKSFNLFGEMRKVLSKVNQGIIIVINNFCQNSSATARRNLVEQEVFRRQESWIASHTARSIFKCKFVSRGKWIWKHKKAPKEFQRVQRLVEEDIKSHSFLFLVH